MLINSLISDKKCLFLIRPLFEARAGIKKFFRLVFGSNENKKIWFQNYLTFRIYPVLVNFSVHIRFTKVCKSVWKV